MMHSLSGTVAGAAAGATAPASVRNRACSGSSSLVRSTTARERLLNPVAAVTLPASSSATSAAEEPARASAAAPAAAAAGGRAGARGSGVSQTSHTSLVSRFMSVQAMQTTIRRCQSCARVRNERHTIQSCEPRTPLMSNLETSSSSSWTRFDFFGAREDKDGRTPRASRSCTPQCEGGNSHVLRV